MYVCFPDMAEASIIAQRLLTRKIINIFINITNVISMNVLDSCINDHTVKMQIFFENTLNALGNTEVDQF